MRATEPFDVTPTLATAIADRRTGVGCDQLIVLEPSDSADLRMRIWNSDGGEVESCGNATRCVVQLTGADDASRPPAGLLEGEDLGAEVEVGIGEPRFGWDEIPLAYPMDTAALPMAWDEPRTSDGAQRRQPAPRLFRRPTRAKCRWMNSGRGSRTTRPFPSGSTSTSQLYVDDRLKLRTFERGAGETLACGTGACASAVAAIVTKRAQSPVTVDMTGGSLTVSWAPGEPIRMRGTATHVFSGELDLDALR